MQRKLMGIISVDFNATGRILINSYSAFVKYLRKKWEYNEAVNQLFIDFKRTYDSIRREVLGNVLIASDYDQFRKTHTYKKSTAITVNPLNPTSGTVTI
jgi:hypothetical protein